MATVIAVAQVPGLALLVIKQPTFVSDACRHCEFFRHDEEVSMADVREVKKMIPRELWRRARAQAILEDKSMRNWIVDLIEDRLGASDEVKMVKGGR